MIKIKEFEELTEQINDLYNDGGFSCFYESGLGAGYVQIRSAMLHGGTQVIITTKGINFDGCIDFKLVSLLNEFITNNDVAKLFQDNAELLEAQDD